MRLSELKTNVVYCWCHDDGNGPFPADDRRFVLTRIDIAANEADFLNTAGPNTGETGTFTDLDLMYDAMVPPTPYLELVANGPKNF